MAIIKYSVVMPIILLLVIGSSINYSLLMLTEFVLELFGKFMVREDNTRDISFILINFDIPLFFFLFHSINKNKYFLIPLFFLFEVIKIELVRTFFSMGDSLPYFFYRVKYIHSINLLAVCIIYLICFINIGKYKGNVDFNQLKL